MNCNDDEGKYYNKNNSQSLVGFVYIKDCARDKAYINALLSLFPSLCSSSRYI